MDSVGFAIKFRLGFERCCEAEYLWFPTGKFLPMTVEVQQFAYEG